MILVMTLTLKMWILWFFSVGFKMCVQCVYNGTFCNGHCLVILQSFVCQSLKIRRVNPVDTKKEWYSRDKLLFVFCMKEYVISF